MKPRSITQWLRRNPAALGLSTIAALLIGLLLYEVILNRFTMISRDKDLLRDFETAVVSILLVGYLAGAYYAVLRSTRDTLDELATWKTAADAVGRDSAGSIGKKGFLAIGLVGALLAAIMNYLTTESAWSWSAWEPEVWWHRILGLFIGWWFAWFATGVADSSEHISRLAARIESVDLLDPSPWFPSVKHGLLTALLTIGAVSISSLYLVDPEVLPGVAIVLGLCLPLALVVFLLPVRGVHRRISRAKEAEIEWTRNRIRQSRSLLHDSSSDVLPSQMADLIAYLELIEGVPVWPFQRSTIVRLLLYLLIPAVSWAGKQLVETALEQLFT